MHKQTALFAILLGAVRAMRAAPGRVSTLARCARAATIPLGAHCALPARAPSLYCDGSSLALRLRPVSGR
jgi:hypothetical protein